MGSKTLIGILLLNLGGPDSLGAVKPFLYNLFSDRDIIKLGPSFLQKPIASLIAHARARKTMNAYAMIGGKSPLLDITMAQAKALEQVLQASSVHQVAQSLRVYVGMRYWHPTIEETVKRMVKDGVRRIFALSLYPHFSIATTGSAIRKFEEVANGYPLEYFSLTSWYDHPLYIEALVEKIQKGMEAFPVEPSVLFSAHSLPQKFIDEGDTYVREIQGTIHAVVQKMVIEWSLSYQSKSGPVKWLEPSTEHMLRELSQRGVRDLLVVPVSFVSDHIETLYEIDILYRKMAARLGMNLVRTESLNTSPTFIRALADIVTKQLNYLNWL